MFFNKKCVKCGKPATHKFVKVESSQIYDMYYCPEHASESSPYQKAKPAIHEILASFLAQGQTPGEQQTLSADPNLTCKTCGLKFEAYRKTLMLGCPDCYESFFEHLVPDLRKFHGNIKHIGRRPGGEKEPAPEAGPTLAIEPPPPIPPPSAPPKPKAEAKPSPKAAESKPSPTKGAAALLADRKAALRELRKTMKQAIAEEDFEKATLCRDRIRELEREIDARAKSD
jgi:protein arginine kinase activator